MTHIQRTLFLTLSLLLLMCLTAAPAWTAPVKGKVVSATDHEPVVRALVLFLHDGTEMARTSTANDGKFYIRDLDPGTYTVEISRGDKEKEFPGTRVRDSDNRLRFEL